MREYYSRFFKAARRSVWLFVKGHLWPNILAAIAIPLLGVAIGTSAAKPAWASVLLGVSFYAAIFLIGVFIALVVAPVTLDRERADENEAGKREIAKLTVEQAKRPHDEHLEADVRAAFEKLASDEQRLVRTLLDQGELADTAIYAAGLRGVPERVIESTNHLLIKYKQVRIGVREQRTHAARRDVLNQKLESAEAVRF